ncbi:MAG TPA: peptidylprolyl isomerase [Thermoanaerobaculia bacterium]|jgi:parvulin-like peptidyl-prolyl isomerase|nr:peptidylprolyl isomerase [Thermoanaerobaculia bacterium]
MRTVLLAGLACGLAVLPLTGCRHQPPPPAPDAAARIGGEDVRYGDFEAYLKRTVNDTDGVLGSDVLSQLFDQFLEERLLVRLAIDRKVAREARNAAGQRAAIEALLASRQPREPASGEDVARYYAAHRQDFARPERVRLRQILTQDRATAERALKEIGGGTEFAEVARRLSHDPGAAAGGYQGELSREDLPPSFAEVIFGLKTGEVSRLVPADYGFHIFQVTEREPAQVISLEAARPEILSKLRQERADRLLQSLVQEARARYNVSVNGRNLPFDYEGYYSDSHAKTTR